MKEIYILLTKSSTIFSRIIHRLSKADYTHAALALDKDLSTLYSFGRKYKYSMLPAGFVRENVYRGLMGSSDSMQCALYKINISDESYQRLCNRLRHMEANKQVYRYNIVGIPMCYFNIELERRKHYFCSQFVSSVLIKSGVIEKSKAPSLTHPCDFQKIPNASRVFEGPIKELRQLGC